jgi:hypothetical protein
MRNLRCAGLDAYFARFLSSYPDCIGAAYSDWHVTRRRGIGCRTPRRSPTVHKISTSAHHPRHVQRPDRQFTPATAVGALRGLSHRLEFPQAAVQHGCAAVRRSIRAERGAWDEWTEVQPPPVNVGLSAPVLPRSDASRHARLALRTAGSRSQGWQECTGCPSRS